MELKDIKRGEFVEFIKEDNSNIGIGTIGKVIDKDGLDPDGNIEIEIYEFIPNNNSGEIYKRGYDLWANCDNVIKIDSSQFIFEIGEHIKLIEPFEDCGVGTILEILYIDSDDTIKCKIVSKIDSDDAGDYENSSLERLWINLCDVRKLNHNINISNNSNDINLDFGNVWDQ